jgi:hypothetical protein
MKIYIWELGVYQVLFDLPTQPLTTKRLRQNNKKATTICPHTNRFSDRQSRLPITKQNVPTGEI